MRTDMEEPTKVCGLGGTYAARSRVRRALLVCATAGAVALVAARAVAQAPAAAMRAQSTQVRDAAFRVITQAMLAMRVADSSIESSDAQLHSTEEAYRARRELFLFSKETSVELADAEASRFYARLAAIFARVDQRIAQMRVEHATGRDVASRAS